LQAKEHVLDDQSFRIQFCKNRKVCIVYQGEKTMNVVAKRLCTAYDIAFWWVENAKTPF
jgi:hypothetical protein